MGVGTALPDDDGILELSIGTACTGNLVNNGSDLWLWNCFECERLDCRVRSGRGGDRSNGARTRVRARHENRRGGQRIGVLPVGETIQFRHVLRRLGEHVEDLVIRG